MEAPMKLTEYERETKPQVPVPQFPRATRLEEKKTTNTHNCEQTHGTSFDAILEAYERDPERWDGLE
jgi:hypothetical protein